MTAYEHVTDEDVAGRVRNQLQSSAQQIPVPDLWSGISERMNGASGQNGSRHQAPRWLASAGTVLFVVLSVVIWVMLVNNQDTDLPVAGEPNGTRLLGRSLEEDPVNFVDGAIFNEIFARLENAGPFKVEGELFTTSRPRGVVSTLPATNGSPALSQEEFRSRFLNNGFIELECVERDPDRACLLGADSTWQVPFELPPECTSTTARPTGVCGNNLETASSGFVSSTPVATMHSVGGTYSFESLYLAHDLYRIQRTLTIDPNFKADVAAKIPAIKLIDDERTVTLQQQRNRYFDSSSPAPGGYGFINTGTTEGFVAAHLDPFLREPPSGSLNDAVTFEDIRLISSSDPNTGFHYRASITGGIGESGTWDMWVGEDGLLRKIMVEVFTSPRWRGDEDGDLETTTITLNFLDYGGPVDSDDPLMRLWQQ